VKDPGYDEPVELVVLTARPDLPANRRLLETAEKLGSRLRIVDATRAVAVAGGMLLVGDGAAVLAPQELGCALARVGNWRPDSVLAALEVLVAGGVPTPNPPAGIRVGRDHWLTVLTLSAANLPVPSTVAGADPETLAEAGAGLGFPLVIKQRRSRMGVGVIRCDQRDHLEAVLDSLWRVGDEVVVQRFVGAGRVSLRLLVVGGRVVAAARFKARSGEWRSNAARGAAAEPYQPSTEDARLAVAASAALGLGVCGVDLLPSSEGSVIGEVNPTPGFQLLERATAVDVAAAIVQQMLGLAESR
jgi:ribosomal protein S6--L-glutamate ligase